MSLTDFIAYANGTQYIPAQSGRLVKGHAMSSKINGLVHDFKPDARPNKTLNQIPIEEWRAKILEALQRKSWRNRKFTQGWDLLEFVIGIKDARATLATSGSEVRAVARILADAGWTKCRPMYNGNTVHAWARPQRVYAGGKRKEPSNDDAVNIKRAKARRRKTLSRLRKLGALPEGYADMDDVMLSAMLAQERARQRVKVVVRDKSGRFASGIAGQKAARDA